jgi:uncharacterized protein (TIGR00661 family)
MARIAISLCGEGRGHATRICTLIERLDPTHEILVYASGDANDLLRRRFSGGPGRIRVAEIPGIVFLYTGGRLDVMRSVAAGFEYQARTLGPLVDRLMGELEDFGADLVVTDFEPALPRAARRLAIPVASVDHQHFLLAYDLGSLPWSLRTHAWLMSQAVWMIVPQPDDVVVSAFFRPPVRKGWEHVVQVGPLLRPEIVHTRPRDEGFVLSYLRRHTPFETIATLADCGMPVKVYGLGHRDHVGNISFHAIDERRFVEDLAHCRAVISAAGNQLIGESLHLGKPMLVLPERAHAEQMMNSHFLRDMQVGAFCPLETVTPSIVRGFLEGLDAFAPALAALRGRMDGTPEVLRVLEHRLRVPVSDAA